MKKTSAKGTTAKHASSKHSSTSKHSPKSTKKKATASTGATVTTLAKKTTGAKATSWSPDEAFPVCSARAVAEALRLGLGLRLSDDDILGLHWAAGGDADTPVTILAAARAWGRPLHVGAAFSSHEASFSSCVPLILGVDLPYGEPHAVCVDLDGTWWSWGEPYQDTDFPGAVIDQAWAVSFA